MKVCTKSNEIVDVDEKKIVEFPEGLLGFESVKKFAIIDSEYEPFIWLQSVENKELAFQGFAATKSRFPNDELGGKCNHGKSVRNPKCCCFCCGNRKRNYADQDEQDAKNEIAL